MKRRLSVRGIAQCVIVALPVLLGALVYIKAVDIPSWDEWEWADIVYAFHTGTLQFSDLWAQHAEHRMFFPKLIVLALVAFGGWHPIREQFVSLAILICSQLLMIALVRRSVFGTAAAIAAAAVSLLLYGLAQAENFDWGFQTAWFLCNFCAIAVAFLLTRRQRRPIDVALALVAAVIGSFSSSQGLLVWAVGAIAIVLAMKKPTLTLGIWIPAALVTYLVYRHGMFAVDVGHINALANPLTELRYVLSYLGAPLARWLGASRSAALGLFCVAVLAAFFVADLRSPHRTRRLVRNAPWYALAIYPLIAAFATASGRAGLGLDQALASRYTTIASVAWIAIVVLVAGRISRGRQPLSERRLGAILAVGTLFLFAIVASDYSGWAEWRTNAGKLALARAELQRSDPAALPIIYPDEQRIILLIGEMRSVHDGIFAGP